MANIKQEDIDEWSADLVDVAGRAGKDAVASDFYQLRQELAALRQQQAQQNQRLMQNAREKMKSDLDASVPAWREINEREEVLQALESKDELSGYKHIDQLTYAWNSNDTTSKTRH